MKKGKTSKLSLIDFAKITYGTVDSKKLNSIYINLQTWVKPKEANDNWERVVLNLSRSIKHTVHENINEDLFEENFIVDLDLRSSGIQEDKKSFMNLEINLFTKDAIVDFKSPMMRKSVENAIAGVLKDNFVKNNYFTFHPSKK